MSTTARSPVCGTSHSWAIPSLSVRASQVRGTLVGHLSLLLFVIFVVDAGITVWRRGDRRQAVVVGGSIVFFVLAATVQTMLARWEVFHWPQTSSLFFLGIVAAMGYELTREVLRAAQLSDDLRESEAADDPGRGGSGLWRLDVDYRNQPGLGLRRGGSACSGLHPMRPITFEIVYPANPSGRPRDGGARGAARVGGPGRLTQSNTE